MPESDNKKQYKRIRRSYLITLRYNANMSQQNVADACNIDIVTYNQIENGKRGNLMNAKKLIALAVAFNVSVEKICHLEADYLDHFNKVNHIERSW